LFAVGLGEVQLQAAVNRQAMIVALR